MRHAFSNHKHVCFHQSFKFSEFHVHLLFN